MYRRRLSASTSITEKTGVDSSLNPLLKSTGGIPSENGSIVVNYNITTFTRFAHD